MRCALSSWYLPITVRMLLMHKLQTNVRKLAYYRLYAYMSPSTGILIKLQVRTLRLSFDFFKIYFSAMTGENRGRKKKCKIAGIHGERDGTLKLKISFHRDLHVFTILFFQIAAHKGPYIYIYGRRKFRQAEDKGSRGMNSTFVPCV